MSNIGPQTSRGEARLAGVEWLRLIACLGIVAFHAQVPGGQAALGGLPAFAMLTVAFAARTARGRSWTSFAHARVQTLLLPWVFWSVVYAAMNAAMALKAGHPAFGWFEPSMWLTGPAIHLWFLPFAMIASLSIGGAVAGRGKGPGADRGAYDWLGWLAAGAATMWLAAMVLDRDPKPPVPFEQYISVLSGIPLGVCLSKIPAGERSSWWRLGVFGVVASGVCVAEMAFGFHAIALPDLVAVISCAIAWGIPAKAGPLTLKFSRLSYGVYLLHPIFALVAYKVAVPMLAGAGLREGSFRWALAGVIAALTMAGTWIARKTWLIRVV